MVCSDMALISNIKGKFLCLLFGNTQVCFTPVVGARELGSAIWILHCKIGVGERFTIRIAKNIFVVVPMSVLRVWTRNDLT